MSDTKIVATIGPASGHPEMLEYFAKHSVQIARLNFSHNTPESHLETANMAREAGLEILFDLPGPKIRLGEVDEVIYLTRGQEIILEPQQAGKKYPYTDKYEDADRLVYPNQFPVHKFVEPGHIILVDDGKMEWKVQTVEGERVMCRVTVSGEVKSRKGMNMPMSKLEVDFLGERDKMMLNALFIEVRPEYVAASFVKRKSDLMQIKKLLTSLLEKAGVTDYFPKVCAKLEMGEALEDQNLKEIVDEADIIMVARGDLALETTPAHITVPFLQEKIKRACRAAGKPFIVATQMLESMIECPVPTRAEVSDLYRAVVLDQANFVMLSGEAATGKYPKNCVNLMHRMITENQTLTDEILGE
ncbi:MAG: hypothetical protein OHK0017_04100 [Patescibacteria group bacterium]